MSNLMPFNYEDQQLRTTLVDGEPWFAAKDVCEVLDITWSGSKTIERISEKHKGVVNFTTPGGVQDLLCVDEPGLYKLIMRSNKPEAEKFQDWITDEVIPQIRKTGSYAPAFQIPQTYSEALRLAADLSEDNEKLKEQNAIMAPKADFFDAVADSKDAIDIGSAAKVLDCGMGRTRLFAFLRDSKILMNNNIPYQEFIDRGYFRVVEQKYSKPDGTNCVNTKTLVYQKGLNYIRKLVTGNKLQIV